MRRRGIDGSTSEVCLKRTDDRKARGVDGQSNKDEETGGSVTADRAQQAEPQDQPVRFTDTQGGERD